MTAPPEDITQLLGRLSSGDEKAGEELFPLIYNQLHSLAKRYMRKERSDHTLQTTALVNEAFLRLGGGKEVDWENRSHFLRFAAQAMRTILIDHARKKGAAKKGGEWDRKPLKDDLVLVGDLSYNILTLNGSLKRLEEVDPQMAKIVELRFFGGLTVEETARVLNISPRTVKSDWRIAKAWLKEDIDK
ncbi:MAG: sigma-70 family RNA polymerase sigma factor [Planctomycetota bacterium]|jgi:RNA polymerase sigma factor (TIGR02999 family)